MIMILMVYMIFELWQIIEIMGNRVGVPMKVAVKRAKDNLVTLTVIPEEFKSYNVSFMRKIWDNLQNPTYKYIHVESEL